jgi:hypothetical protein
MEVLGKFNRGSSSSSSSASSSSLFANDRRRFSVHGDASLTLKLNVPASMLQSLLDAKKCKNLAEARCNEVPEMPEMLLREEEVKEEQGKEEDEACKINEDEKDRTVMDSWEDFCDNGETLVALATTKMESVAEQALELSEAAIVTDDWSSIQRDLPDYFPILVINLTRVAGEHLEKKDLTWDEYHELYKMIKSLVIDNFNSLSESLFDQGNFCRSIYYFVFVLYL